MSPQNLSDTEIIKHVQQGQHEDWFGLLVERYQARIRAMVAHYIINRDDAYDIMQDVFLEAYRHIQRFDANQDFLPWLRALCRHRILNYFRAQKTHYAAIQKLIQTTLEQELGNGASSDDGTDEARLAALKRCTGKLDPQNQTLLQWRYHAGLAIRDIAQRMDLSVGSISMRLNRMRTLLARCMERELNRVGEGS